MQDSHHIHRHTGWLILFHKSTSCSETRREHCIMPSLWPEQCLAAKESGTCHPAGSTAHAGQHCSLHLTQSSSATAPHRLHHLQPCKNPTQKFERKASCTSVKSAASWCKDIGAGWNIQETTHDINRLNAGSCKDHTGQTIRQQPRGYYTDSWTSGPQLSLHHEKPSLSCCRGLLGCSKALGQWYGSNTAVPFPLQNFDYACQFVSQHLPQQISSCTH